MRESLQMKKELTEQVGRSMALWNSVLHNLNEHTDLDSKQLHQGFKEAEEESMCNVTNSAIKESTTSSLGQFILPKNSEAGQSS